MPGLAFLLIIAIAIGAIRSPLVRRIGLRNAVRRPREAMLVMLGCVLGTALIVGTSAVGDSFTESIRHVALDRLGQVDARVSYPTRDDWSAANARFAAQPPEHVAIAAAAATLELPLTSDSSNEPSPRAKLIEADYRRAGLLTETTGVKAAEGPTAGTAWASKNLARRLNLEKDSVITVHTGVPDQNFLITKIFDGGLMTFLDGQFDSGDNLLVSPGTIDILRQQNPKALFPRYLTLIGGDGEKITDASQASKADPLEESLGTFTSAFEGEVNMVRADSLKAAKVGGETAGAFLVTIGGFGIIAGILLLVNVLLMLAEERLAELGTMRAVGLPRQPLIAAFSLEGSLYALAGSIIGGFFGVGLGSMMVSFATRATNTIAPTGGAKVPLEFTLQPATLVNGIAVGFVISTLAVIGTSYRISRLDVIRALRDLPPVPGKHRKAATPLLILGLIVGPVLSWAGYTIPASIPFSIGAPIAFTCVGVLVSRKWGYNTGVVVATVPTIIWHSMFEILDQDRNTPPSTTIILGVWIVIAGVLLLNSQQATLANIVRRIGRGRATVTTRVGLANPIAHRVRMLLTVGPFALVVFTLVFAEGLSNIITTQIAHVGPTAAGDYQLYASSSPANPYDFTKLNASGVEAVAPVSPLIAQFQRVDKGADPDVAPRVWPTTAFDQSLTKVKPPLLVQRSKEYASDRAAYNAVLRDPNLILIPTSFLLAGDSQLGGNNRPNDQRPDLDQVYSMVDPVSGRQRDVRVVGVIYADVTSSGAFVGAQAAKEMFGDRVIPSNAFLDTSGDVNGLRTQLQQAGIDNGVKVVVFTEEVERFFRFLRSVVNLYRSDLGIGLVVGIAGVGVVLVRSVRDRRRQIGTLRAMGFEANSIGRSFLIEGGFIASQALFVGAGLAQVMVINTTKGNQLQAAFGESLPTPTPTLSVGLLCVALLLAALAASAGPARRATKIPPAVALRLVD